MIFHLDSALNFVSFQDTQRKLYEQEREQILCKAKSEYDEAEDKHEKAIAQLKDEIAAVHKDRDESLLMAENDKQQVRKDNSLLIKMISPSEIATATTLVSNFYF